MKPIFCTNAQSQIMLNDVTTSGPCLICKSFKEKLCRKIMLMHINFYTYNVFEKLSFYFLYKKKRRKLSSQI